METTVQIKLETDTLFSRRLQGGNNQTWDMSCIAALICVDYRTSLELSLLNLYENTWLLFIQNAI